VCVCVCVCVCVSVCVCVCVKWNVCGFYICVRDVEGMHISARWKLCVCVCVGVCMCVDVCLQSKNQYVHLNLNVSLNLNYTKPLTHTPHTRWRRSIGCLEIQVSFRKTITNYRALLRKLTCKDQRNSMPVRHSVPHYYQVVFCQLLRLLSIHVLL